MYPKNFLYTEEHEWLNTEGSEVTIGVTSFAAEQLGDIVFVELPEPGESFSKGDTFGTIESVKAVSDLYMPIDGEVIAINEDLEDTPELVNSNPFEEGWMVKLTISDESQLSELMNVEDYEKFVKEQAE